MESPRIEDRVWRELPGAARRALETGLSPTELQSLLLSVTRTRAREVNASRLVQRWGSDRFVRPAPTDPRRLARVEARLWELLPEVYAGVELAPVVPLGTCSALGPVDQHRIVSTVRGTEVLSDPTNALAVEAAVRRGAGAAGQIDLAASHRVLRAQTFGPGASQHFRLFALVSTARDTGSGRTESRLLVEHIGFWQRVLADLLPGHPSRITVTAFSPLLTERVHDTVLPAVADGPVPVVPDQDRTQGAGYYAGAAIGLRAEHDGRTVDLGDGGLTTWTAQLLADAKERCLISCISTERLTALTTPST
ncbi:hypothetical protein F4553_002264 [Allocatelliglobosispora scoriae]|uniref:Uncharacterized protein n=1 Tax=Allocatelliglobosispora scoriae TaxID=643052 RepID=A0A841BMJ2_9ACTN|nr:hypothetical protein [Allocatelliglobosispora scoriae]MBB5868885.1 hypothetical protein [Allocatelliglobosispora scoriae]